MKILLTHITNTYNYGSMMMAENVITYINKYSKQKNEYYTDCNTDDDIKRLKEATGYEEIKKDKIICKESNNKVQTLINIIRSGHNSKKASGYYDYIIILGGDDFSEVYMNNILQRFLTIKAILDLKKLNKNNNVFLLGQTIGPYTGIRKWLAKRVFRKITLYTRDDLNLVTMKNEYEINAIPSRDLAFLDLQKQNEYINKKNEILNKYNLRENNYITIVGTQLIDKYCDDREKFIDMFIKIIKLINAKEPKKDIVWLSHVTTEPYNLSDNYLLELLNEKEEFKNINKIVIKEKILPVEARIILGNSKFVFTCRMHAAVSTFQMGKPAICLSYSPKYKGVISDGLNLSELVIEAKEKKIWNGNLINEVSEKIDMICSNYEELTNKINKEVKNSQSVALNTIKEIVEKMNKGVN